VGGTTSAAGDSLPEASGLEVLPLDSALLTAAGPRGGNGRPSSCGPWRAGGRRRLIRRCFKGEIEPVLRSVRLELHLGRQLNWQGFPIHARFQVTRTSHHAEREGGKLGCLVSARIERLLGNHTGTNLVQSVGRQRPGVIVVEIQPEHTLLRVSTFEVVPVVWRHEELTTMLRIVIPVWPKCAAHDHGRAVGACPGLEMFDARLRAAPPRQRRGHANQLAATEGTRARSVVGDARVNRTGPGGVETYRYQGHLAERA